MWRYYPDLLAKPVPRYTSFPTAAEFADGIGPADLRRALASLEGEISLYLHIPFCEKICWYCGCNTSAANRGQRLASYLEALHREIALVADLLPGGVRVARIAFGGGSPNAIAPTDFVRLVDSLTLHFPLVADPVISCEFDPRTLEAPWREAIAGVGMQRASLGVQTFSPQLQRAIGRVQPAETIARAADLLRDAGIESLNFDLIYGLPGQVLHDLADSIERTAGHGADRVALFGYAHIPELVARQRRIDAAALPDAQARFAMAAFGFDLLTEAGYMPVGFDHFALPGDSLAQAALTSRLRRNFQGFTDDTAAAVIGLGASAISSLPGLLAQNEKNAGRYRMLLSRDRLATSRGIVRSASDRERGALIEELLCRGLARPSFAVLSTAMPELTPFIERGLVSFDRGSLVIAPEGRPYARAIAACFDPYRQQGRGRFSSAV